MKSTYFLFALLVAVCYARQEFGKRENNRNANHNNNQNDNRSDDGDNNRSDDRSGNCEGNQWFQPSETSTQEPSTTSTTVITTIAPCSECQNVPISISDNFAGQCIPSWEGATCTCLCGDVFCNENQIIDRSTCKPDGKLSDCKCIPVESTTTPPTETTTTLPTTGTGYTCEYCPQYYSIDNSEAGYCNIDTTGADCICVCVPTTTVGY